MLPGRRTIPEDEKKLAGTLRADRLKGALKFNVLNIVPAAPDWLDAGSKKIFGSIAELLIGKQMLFESDVHLLAILAKELSVYEMACRELKTKKSFVIETKTGYQQPSPWVAIRSQAQKNVRDIGSLFGLDPLSRSRFNVKEDEKDDNPFGNL